MDYQKLAEKYGGTVKVPNQQDIPQTQAPVSQTSAPVSAPQAVDYQALAQKHGGTVKQPEMPEEEPAQKSGFFKSLVEAPVTLAARPLQALQAIGNEIGRATTKSKMENLIAEQNALVGQLHDAQSRGEDTATIRNALKEKMDEYQNTIVPQLDKQGEFVPFNGGVIAKAPENLSYSEIAPDIGRAIQTVSLGLGPIAGGAGVGFGQGIQNKDSIGDIALQTAGGAALGGVLGAVAPKIAGFGVKVADTVLPNIVKKGISTAADFVAPALKKAGNLIDETKILPEGVSNTINALPNAAEKLFTGGKKGLSSAIANQYKGNENMESIVKGLKGKSGPMSPERIMDRVTRVNPTVRQKFIQTTGMSHGDFAVKNDLFGSPEQITQKAFTLGENSKKMVDNTLEQLPGTYKPEALGTALDDLLARETRVSAPGAESKNLARTKELATKFNEEGLTMSEINEAKRLYEKNVKMDYLKSAQMNPENVVRATNIDSAIREEQMRIAKELGFENLAEMNKQTQAAYQFATDIWKSHSKEALNNALGLTDWITLSGGNPASIGMFFGKKIFGNKSVQSGIAKTLSKGKQVAPITPLFTPKSN